MFTLGDHSVQRSLATEEISVPTIVNSVMTVRRRSDVIKAYKWEILGKTSLLIFYQLPNC
jgi:hypothetical protein